MDNLICEDLIVNGTVNGVTVGEGSRYLKQTAWYIDAINGNDENTGRTTSDPLKTFAEVSRRWGRNNLIKPESGKVVAVYLMSDLPASDPISFNVRLGSSTVILFKGLNTTTRFSGTFTNVVVKNRATNTFLQVTDSALTGTNPWTASSPMGTSPSRILDRTNGASFWMLRETASGTATCSEPIVLPDVVGTNFPWIGTTHRPASPVAIGDSYVVQRLTQAYVGTLSVLGADNSLPTGVTANSIVANSVVFEDLHIVRYSSQHYITFIGENMTGLRTYGSYVEPGIHNQSGNGDMHFGASFFRNGVGGIGGFYHIRACVINSFGANGTLLGVTMDLDTVVMGNGWGVPTGMHKLGTVGFFECSSSAAGNNKQGNGLAVFAGAHASFQTFSDSTHALYGTGSQGAGVRVEAGGTFTYQTNIPTVVGSNPGVNDFNLAGATTSRGWDENTGTWTAAFANSWANLTSSLSGSAHNVAAGARIARAPGI